LSAAETDAALSKKTHSPLRVFYPHFHLWAAGRRAERDRVCADMSCHLNGACEIGGEDLENKKRLIRPEGKVRRAGTWNGKGNSAMWRCIGGCDHLRRASRSTGPNFTKTWNRGWGARGKALAARRRFGGGRIATRMGHTTQPSRGWNAASDSVRWGPKN